MNLCNDADEALDLLNEVLIRIVITIGRYDHSKAKLSTWVKNVTSRFLIDNHRNQQESTELVTWDETDLDLFPSHYPSPEEHAEQIEETESGKKNRKKKDPDITRLRKAMSGLSRRDRQILLYRAEGFDYESIGSFLKMNPGTAMTAYSRSIKKVRERFTEES